MKKELNQNVSSLGRKHLENIKNAMTEEEKETTAWIFRTFSNLSLPQTTTAQKEELLHSVFVKVSLYAFRVRTTSKTFKLQQCDSRWITQLDVLDIFGNIVDTKPEILYGCKNVMDLVLDTVEIVETKVQVKDRLFSLLFRFDARKFNFKNFLWQ